MPARASFPPGSAGQQIIGRETPAWVSTACTPASGWLDGTAITCRFDRGVGQSRTSRYWPYPPSPDPCTSGVYFVDDHFVPYAGAKPVPKGWDTKHRVAQRGRAETWVVDAGGRAVVFTTGEPSGLTKTLPPALGELRTVIGPTAKIMLGFDRGGAYASVFTACRDAGADWITYRRAPLAPVHGLPMTTIITSTNAKGMTQPSSV